MEAKHQKHIGKRVSREKISIGRGVLHNYDGTIIVETDGHSRNIAIDSRTGRTGISQKKSLQLRWTLFRFRREKTMNVFESHDSTTMMHNTIEEKMSELRLASALAALEDEIVKTNESTEKLIGISKGILENE